MSEHSSIPANQETSSVPSASATYTTFRRCKCSERFNGYFWRISQKQEVRIPVAAISIMAGRKIIEFMLENGRIKEAEIPRLEQELASSGLREIAVSEEYDSSFTDNQLLRLVVPPELLEPYEVHAE